MESIDKQLLCKQIYENPLHIKEKKTLEFNLLQYEEKYSAVQPFLNVGRIMPYHICQNDSSEEYDYQGFEYGQDALDRVCAHAAYMAQKMEKYNDEASRSALSRDYRNAIKCLSVGKYGNRETIDRFTEYMLYEDWDTVFESITEMYEANKLLEQDKLIDYRFIPDYDRLFVTLADNALFNDDDFDIAIQGYTAATYEWKSKYADSHGIYSLPVGSKHKIKLYISMFVSIRNGNYLGDDLSFLSEREGKIIDSYKQIVLKYNQHDEIVEDVEKLIQDINMIIRQLSIPTNNMYYSYNKHPMFDNSHINTLRTICVLIPSLYKFAYLDEIYLLTKASREIQLRLKTKALGKLTYLRTTDYDWVSFIIPLLKGDNSWKALSLVAKTEKDIKQIKKRLLINENIPHLAYYTTWETFSHMLPTDNITDDSNVGKLSIMHLSYMNDPMEGKVLQQYLNESDDCTGRKVEKQSYEFVKCFTQSIDYLPMWKMYGGDAKGCCIVINWDKTKKCNKGEKIELYRVCYLSKKNNKYIYQKVDNNDKSLEGLGEILAQLKKDIIALRKVEEDWSLSDILLSSIQYLFKDSSYSYEKEARILYSYTKYNNDIKETRQNPPKLFVYSNYRVVIDEIILGPKFENVYLWSPYIISQIEKMNKGAGFYHYTKLTLSEINYR